MQYRLKNDDFFLRAGMIFNRTSGTNWKIVKDDSSEIQLDATDSAFFESKKNTHFEAA
mgnify:CR=1 FL=1